MITSRPTLARFVCAVAIALTLTAFGPRAFAQQTAPLVSFDALLAPELQTNVSFEVKSLPLQDLLRDLQKRSGITLRYNPDPQAPPLLITARVKDLPLSEVMRSLRRLYGVAWQSDAPKKWRLLPSQNQAIEVDLLRFGEANSLQTLRLKRTRDQRPNWLAEVLQTTNDAALNAEQGVSLSALPDDLRARLRGDNEENAAYKIIEDHLRAQSAVLENDQLSFELLPTRPASNTSAPSPSLQVLVRSDDGRLIAPLGILKSAAPPAER